MNLKFVWTIPIDAPPEKVWRYIADTNRVNQYAGLPEFTFKFIPEAGGGSRQVGETKYMGIRLRWDEHPFEWIEGRYYEIVRAYHNGPIRNFHTAVSLRANNGGSLLEQTITCEPRWSFAIPAIYWEVGFSARRRFRAAYRKIEKFLQGESQTPFVPVPRIAIPPQRLEAVRRRLENAAGRRWLPRLIEAIETMADEDLDAMRPFVFADIWDAERIEVLKLFLHASQAGLLDLSWDVICPRCRGAQERHESLKRLRSEAHCAACNIRYTADFAESVEITFRPNPAVRMIEVVRYCSGGPMNAPHVVAQQRIPARQSRTIEMRLSPWDYHVRSPKLEAQTLLHTRSDAESSSATVAIRRPALEPDKLDMKTEISLTLQNRDDQDIMVTIERAAGNENASTAAMVIALNEFRTLFSEEVLAPETPVSVGAIALMFTDLKASTNLYEEIGEAPAYALVRRHFDLLRETVAKSQGTLVKTIGDAVMAAFFDPAKALEAAFAMHRAIHDDNLSRGSPALSLKVGIHHGACIAVNLNDILDYFGTAVNVAARIQKESLGGDIVVTEEVWQDPHVQRMLAGAKFQEEVIHCSLRGLSGSRTIHRIQPLALS